MRNPLFVYLPRVMILCLALGVGRASIAQDLALELFGRMHMPSGKLVERSVENDDVLRSGDEFRVRVQASLGGFLYVIHQGTTRAMVLYPSSVEPAAARVRAGDEIVLPGEGIFFTLDETLGPERVLVLVTQAPIQDMNAVLEVAAVSPIDRNALSAAGVGQADELVFRHIESTSPAAASAALPSDSALSEDVPTESSGERDQILGDVGSRIDELLLVLDAERPAAAPAAPVESNTYAGAEGESAARSDTELIVRTESTDTDATSGEYSTRQDGTSEQLQATSTVPPRNEPPVENTSDVPADDPNDLAAVTVVEDTAALPDSGEAQSSDASQPNIVVPQASAEGSTTNSPTSSEQNGAYEQEPPIRAAEPLVDLQDVIYEEQLLDDQKAAAPVDDPADADRVTVVEDAPESEAPVDVAMTESSLSDDENDVATVSVVSDETPAVTEHGSAGGDASALGSNRPEEALDQASVAETEAPSPKDTTAAEAAASQAAKFQLVYSSAVLIPTSRGIAAGVLLDTKGHILTNWHVVEGRQVVSLLVQVDAAAGGAARMTTARVLGSSQAPDLALLRLQAPVLQALQPIGVPQPLRLELGDVVYALGSANSTLALTMARGKVDRFAPYASWQSADNVAHAASVIHAKVREQPGSSGTLLLDDNMRLVGIGVSSDNGTEMFSAVSLDSILEFLSEYGRGNVRLSKG